MGILGIKNRTENWKTARTFAPFYGANSVRLARRLLGPDATLEPGDVRLELFWKGVRDLIDGRNRGRPKAEKKKFTDYEDEFGASFERHFGGLRAAIKRFIKEQPRVLNSLRGRNYTTNGNLEDGTSTKTKLASNLNGIEIDIVLETPEHLLIGEAKDESNFGTDGSQVLVHQLMGQYVQATVLLDVLKIEKQVMPFIVCDDKAAVMRSGQIQFMLRKGWLKEDRILTWDDIEALR